MIGSYGTGMTIEKPKKNKKQSCWKCRRYNPTNCWCNSYQMTIRNTSLGKCEKFAPKRRKA